MIISYNTVLYALPSFTLDFEYELAALKPCPTYVIYSYSGTSHTLGGGVGDGDSGHPEKKTEQKEACTCSEV